MILKTIINYELYTTVGFSLAGIIFHFISWKNCTAVTQIMLGPQWRLIRWIKMEYFGESTVVGENPKRKWPRRVTVNVHILLAQHHVNDGLLEDPPLDGYFFILVAITNILKRWINQPSCSYFDYSEGNTLTSSINETDLLDDSCRHDYALL